MHQSLETSTPIATPIGLGIGVIEGLKCRYLTSDESQQCRRCVGVFFPPSSFLHSLRNSENKQQLLLSDGSDGQYDLSLLFFV